MIWKFLVSVTLLLVTFNQLILAIKIKRILKVLALQNNLNYVTFETLKKLPTLLKNESVIKNDLD